MKALLNPVPVVARALVAVAMDMEASGPTVTDSVVVPEGPNDWALAGSWRSAPTAPANQINMTALRIFMRSYKFKWR